MPIYISKNNQQTGPYEEHIVIDQLRSGLLSPDDLGIRPGDPSWSRLAELFPGIGRSSATEPVRNAQAFAGSAASTGARATAATSAQPEPQYRNTILQKIFFGLCFLGAIGIFAATVYYIFSFGSTGNLESDLSRMSFRDLGKYAFREWTLPVKLAAGPQELKVRATSNGGDTQPMEPLWNPAGYLRNVVETVRVTAA